MTGVSRRRFLAGGLASTAAVAGVASTAAACGDDEGTATSAGGAGAPRYLEFEGAHQTGITHPANEQGLLAAFDLTATSLDDVRETFVALTEETRRLMAGEPYEDRGYRWHFGRGASAGAIPTNGGLHVVFAGVPPVRFRAAARSDKGAFLARVLGEVHQGLAAEVRAAIFATEPVAFAGEPGFLRRAAGPGWALVGDAGYFKDPFTAHGITDALRDAEILARAVIAGTDAALRRYVATRDALSRPLFEATDALAALDWSYPEAKALHKALSAAMKAEQDWLAAGAPSLRRAA